MTGTEVSCSRHAHAAIATAAAIAAAATTVGAVAAPGPARPAAPNVVTPLPALGARIAAAINTARGQRGLTRLRLYPPLRAAAAVHSLDMARSGFFSHASSDGTSLEVRLARFYPAAGYRRRQIGETLLWDAGVVDSAAVVRAWLSSPGHRAILLAPGFRDLGVAAVEATAAPGFFHGTAATLVTADFGARTR